MCKLEQYTSSTLQSPVSLLFFQPTSYVDWSKISTVKLQHSQCTIKAQLIIIEKTREKTMNQCFTSRFSIAYTGPETGKEGRGSWGGRFLSLLATSYTCSILLTAERFQLNTHCSPTHIPLGFNTAKMFLLSHSKNLLNDEIFNYGHINLGRIFEVQKLSTGSCRLPTYAAYWPCNSLYIISVSTSELLYFRLCHWWWISNNKEESSLSSEMIVQNFKKAN